MKKKLVAIHPNKKVFRVELNPGDICNYKCPYCIEKNKLGKTDWLEWHYLKKFCLKVMEQNKNRDIVFSISNGGEPTLYPHIDDLLDLVKDHFVLVGSNGSRSIDWWDRHLDKIDDLVISCHYTEIDKDKFLKKIKYLSKKKLISIIIPLYSPIFWEQYEYGKKLVDSCDNIFISFKTLSNKPKEPEYKYTSDQLQYFLDNPYLKSVNYDNSQTKIDISCFKIYDDGSEEYTRPQLIVANNENRFKGWKCWAGCDFLRVDEIGKICYCNIWSPYDIYSDYDLPNEPIICTKEKCNCIPAISVKKEKIK